MRVNWPYSLRPSIGVHPMGLAAGCVQAFNVGGAPGPELTPDHQLPGSLRCRLPLGHAAAIPWEHEVEHAANAGRASNSDVAPLGLDESTGQREAEPRPFVLSRHSTAHLTERLEQARQIGFCDPDPGVFDLDTESGVSLRQDPHLDPAFVRGELQGVRQIAIEDLTQPKNLSVN